ncbi:MAG: mechanosensitive ion channel family protein [Lentisphaeria bacterium]
MLNLFLSIPNQTDKLPADDGIVNQILAISPENLNIITSNLLKFGKNILCAILIFVIGRIIGKILAKIANKTILHTSKDTTLASFVKNLVFFVTMVFVVIASLTELGLETASIVAAVGAAGLAIGLAFQGALSNFAAGFMIIAFRPFKVGDLIDAGGCLGHVREIEPFTTKLTTPDNKTVIMPNHMLTSDKIINYTETKDLRVDLVFSCSYGDDIDKVKSILYKILKDDPRVHSEPEPFVGLIKHDESSINFVVRPWVDATEYWHVYYDVTEKVKKEFDKNNITIPFPQRDIHIVSDIRK